MRILKRACVFLCGRVRVNSLFLTLTTLLFICYAVLLGLDVFYL